MTIRLEDEAAADRARALLRERYEHAMGLAEKRQRRSAETI